MSPCAPRDAQQGAQSVERGAARGRQGCDVGSVGKSRAHSRNAASFCSMKSRQRVEPRLGLDRWRRCVRSRDHPRQIIRERKIESSLIGEPVERRVLVEPAHPDRPFDRLAVTAERQSFVGSADRNDTAIDLRRERPVDRKLGVASRLAFCEG